MLKLFFSDEFSLTEFASFFASFSPENATVYLEGELGAGKTTFTRGFLRGLQYEGFVKSPTYTIVEPYEVAEKKVFHFDLYRIADPEELSFLGIEEYFSQTALRLIEWPDKGQDYLQPADIVCEIFIESSGRTLQITALSQIGKSWLEKL